MGYLCDYFLCGLYVFVVLVSVLYDVMVFDFLLFDVDGFDLFLCLCNDGVILLVLIFIVCDGVEDCIFGFDWGGDDYFVKLFVLGELEVCLCVLLCCCSDVFVQKWLGCLCFDSICNEVQVDGQCIELIVCELLLVEVLMQYFGCIVIKQCLFDVLYSWDYEVSLLVIEVYVSCLCCKLEQVCVGVGICMLCGFGYCLEVVGD